MLGTGNAYVCTVMLTFGFFMGMSLATLPWVGRRPINLVDFATFFPAASSGASGEFASDCDSFVVAAEQDDPIELREARCSMRTGRQEPAKWRGEREPQVQIGKSEQNPNLFGKRQIPTCRCS
jgi:hypothetical protein